jgi:hypothetical protein
MGVILCISLSSLLFGIGSKYVKKSLFLPYAVLPFQAFCEIISCISLIIFNQFII